MNLKPFKIDPEDEFYLEEEEGESLPVCSYLKWIADPTIRYGFPHPANYCHKPNKPRQVSLTYQDQVCINGSYKECPVYKQVWIGRLPEEIAPVKKKFNGRVFIPLIIAIILLIAAIIYLVLSA
jgi:hypothetical protein